MTAENKEGLREEPLWKHLNPLSIALIERAIAEGLIK